MKNNFWKWIFLIFLTTSCKVNHLVRTDAIFYRMNTESIDSDNAVEALIEPYKAQLEQTQVVIGEVETTLTKQSPESNLGNWMMDALHVQSEKQLGEKIDFSVLNYGGIRLNSIPAGPLTKNKLLELMPFDNFMVVLEIDGSTMKTFINHMANSGGWPASWGLKYKIVDRQAQEITINDQELDLKQIYKVSMTDYMANGGSRCDFLKIIPQKKLGIYVRDMLQIHVEELTKKGEKISAKIEGRITN